MAIKVITAPASEPVTLAEAKLHLKVDGTDEDSLIQTYIQTAREHIEDTCHRALVTQTLEYVISRWPENDLLELPRPPLQSVTSIKYKDTTGLVETTWSSGEYVVNADETPGMVVPAYGKSWPTAALYPRAGIRVRYQAGYGAPVAAALTTNLGTANADLVYTAANAGKAGNSITVAYLNPSATHTLSLAVDGSIITITLGYAGGVLTSKASDVKALVQADAAASALVTVAYRTGHDGTGTVPAMAATHLAGGSDALPAALKSAILLIVGHLYENRQLAAAQALQEIPYAVTSLLAPYQVFFWGMED